MEDCKGKLFPQSHRSVFCQLAHKPLHVFKAPAAILYGCDDCSLQASLGMSLSILPEDNNLFAVSFKIISCYKGEKNQNQLISTDSK